jgi:SAM-dependent methyltransferase
MAGDTPPYVHGTSKREQERLRIMNDILNQAALREIALRGGERVLDLGCGTGLLSRDLARAARARPDAAAAGAGAARGGAGLVVAVERSPEQLREARRLARDAGEEDRVDFRQGDALAPPLRDDEWGGFDLAHTRFLLEHLPRPVEVVRVMLRAVRPGGRIVVQDEDHDILRLWPEPEGVMEIWRAYIRGYEIRGLDPFVGRRLPAILLEAGARPVRSAWIDFGGCAGTARFGALVENMARVLESAEEAVVGAGLAEGPEFHAAISSLRAWGGCRDAALWYALACVEGIRPGTA